MSGHSILPGEEENIELAQNLNGKSGLVAKKSDSDEIQDIRIEYIDSRKIRRPTGIIWRDYAVDDINMELSAN